MDFRYFCLAFCPEMLRFVYNFHFGVLNKGFFLHCEIKASTFQSKRRLAAYGLMIGLYRIIGGNPKCKTFNVHFANQSSGPYPAIFLMGSRINSEAIGSSLNKAVNFYHIDVNL